MSVWITVQTVSEGLSEDVSSSRFECLLKMSMKKSSILGSKFDARRWL